MPYLGYIPIVGSNLKLKVFIAAVGQSNIFRAVLLETNINTAAFCLAGCGAVGCFILEVFWFGFFFPPPLQNESGFISFGIGMSLEGKTTTFKKQLPDFKWMSASMWNSVL